MRRFELLVRFDIPKNKLQWKMLGDYIESQFSIESTKHLGGHVKLGYTWRTGLRYKPDPSMIWSSLAREIMDRVSDSNNRETVEILDSKIIESTDFPYVELVLEGE